MEVKEYRDNLAKKICAVTHEAAGNYGAQSFALVFNKHLRELNEAKSKQNYDYDQQYSSAVAIREHFKKADQSDLYQEYKAYAKSYTFSSLIDSVEEQIEITEDLAL